MEKEKHLSHDYDENIQYIHDYLAVDKSFDLIQLNLHYAGRRMSLFLIDGLIKDEMLHYLMKFLALLDEEELEENPPLEQLMQRFIPYVEIDTETDLNKTANLVLGGTIRISGGGIR